MHDVGAGLDWDQAAATQCVAAKILCNIQKFHTTLDASSLHKQNQIQSKRSLIKSPAIK